MQHSKTSSSASREGLVIRKGKESDVEKIKPYLISSWVMHARHEPDLLDEKSMKDADVEKYYLDALRGKNCSFLVAEVDGQIAGFVRADVKSIEGFFKDNKILYIDDVFTVDMFRGRGVARALLLEVESEAKRMGIRGIQGRVYAFNGPMQRLLRSMDYKSPHATWDKRI